MMWSVSIKGNVLQSICELMNRIDNPMVCFRYASCNEFHNQTNLLICCPDIDDIISVVNDCVLPNWFNETRLVTESKGFDVGSLLYYRNFDKDEEVEYYNNYVMLIERG